VAFFTGCVSSLYPMVYAIPQAFVQLLERAGVGYVTLNGEEWCCGYPLMAAGLDADALIAHNVADIAALGVTRVVATCPSCYKTFKTRYPQDQFEALHATQLLLKLLEEGRLRPAHTPRVRRDPSKTGPLRVTYHDPCDLGRKAGVYEPPRQILARIPGIELVEMETNRALASCCGGGGNLESLEPDLSAAIADRRFAQAQSVGAEVIVSACQQCQRTLGMAGRRARSRVPVMDIAQILLASLDEAA
jgi:heterodisulfide reductase subunit D